MRRIQAIILCNEHEIDHINWINACETFKKRIEYRIVDLTGNGWLEEIQKYPFDVLLSKPGGLTALFKQLYDERIYILDKIFGYYIFPSAEEIFLYENKRFLSFWLKANRIPHPHTYVFYRKHEAYNFLSKQSMPIVGKINIGASGSGVIILNKISEAKKYISNAFSTKGLSRQFGPSFRKKGIITRAIKLMTNPSNLLLKINAYNSIRMDKQYGFVIFQEYIPHSYEWRVVRIGDSFFAHKKLKLVQKASGNLMKSYVNPPIELLNFVKELTDRFGFYSQAVDIFESERGYLINEMQCIFGQSDPYQMLINNKPGRYKYINGGWIFEEGNFNENMSYNLRVEFIIDHIDKK
jgi:glutathione synthase/RimK-type ligase-like ATP-grasp enzyme